MKHPPGVAEAEIKRMWVAEPRVAAGSRGCCVELEARAAAAGATVARLETNRTLVEAHAMYRAAGYEEVEPFNAEPFAHHWFAKRLDAAPSGYEWCSWATTHRPSSFRNPTVRRRRRSGFSASCSGVLHRSSAWA